MNSLALTSQQIATLLKNRRRALGLTQKEVAAQVGLLPKTVSALEQYPDRCSVESLRKLLAALRLELVFAPKPEAEDMQRHGEW